MNTLLAIVNVTYFQFQCPPLVCFYTLVEVHWLPIMDSKRSSKNHF